MRLIRAQFEADNPYEAQYSYGSHNRFVVKQRRRIWPGTLTVYDILSLGPPYVMYRSTSFLPT